MRISDVFGGDARASVLTRERRARAARDEGRRGAPGLDVHAAQLGAVGRTARRVRAGVHRRGEGYNVCVADKSKTGKKKTTFPDALGGVLEVTASRKLKLELKVEAAQRPVPGSRWRRRRPRSAPRATW